MNENSKWSRLFKVFPGQEWRSEYDKFELYDRDRDHPPTSAIYHRASGEVKLKKNKWKPSFYINLFATTSKQKSAENYNNFYDAIEQTFEDYINSNDDLKFGFQNFISDEPTETVEISRRRPGRGIEEGAAGLPQNDLIAKIKNSK